jgi:hypothetical protein
VILYCCPLGPVYETELGCPATDTTATPLAFGIAVAEAPLSDWTVIGPVPFGTMAVAVEPATETIPCVTAVAVESQDVCTTLRI